MALKKFIISISALGLALIISGCGTATSSQSETLLSSTPAIGSDTMMESKIAPDRAIIKTSSLSIRVKNVEESVLKATEVTTKFEGRVDEVSQYKNPGSEESLSANMVIRVPVVNLETSISELKKLGDVESSSISASDVTLQKVDLVARISALQISVDKFKQLIASATNTSDLIAAETALAERQGELDSLINQLKYLTDQVDLSVIYLTLYPNDSFNSIKPIGFLAGIEKGFVALLNALVNLTSIIGYILPWIIVVAVTILVFKLVSRIRNR